MEVTCRGPQVSGGSSSSSVASVLKLKPLQVREQRLTLCSAQQQRRGSAAAALSSPAAGEPLVQRQLLRLAAAGGGGALWWRREALVKGELAAGEVLFWTEGNIQEQITHVHDCQSVCLSASLPACLSVCVAVGALTDL